MEEKKKTREKDTKNKRIKNDNRAENNKRNWKNNGCYKNWGNHIKQLNFVLVYLLLCRLNDRMVMLAKTPIKQASLASIRNFFLKLETAAFVAAKIIFWFNVLYLILNNIEESKWRRRIKAEEEERQAKNFQHYFFTVLVYAYWEDKNKTKERKMNCWMKIGEILCKSLVFGRQMFS